MKRREQSTQRNARLSTAEFSRQFLFWVFLLEIGLRFRGLSTAVVLANRSCQLQVTLAAATIVVCRQTRSEMTISPPQECPLAGPFRLEPWWLSRWAILETNSGEGFSRWLRKD